MHHYACLIDWDANLTAFWIVWINVKFSFTSIINLEILLANFM